MDIRGFLIFCWGLFVLGCNRSALPLPAMGPNQNSSYTTIPFPPPAPKAEVIPPKPGNRVVWIDGSWTWDRRRWVWQKGKWAVPPTGAHYALAKIVQLPDGSLGWVPGGWQTPGVQNTQTEQDE